VAEDSTASRIAVARLPERSGRLVTVAEDGLRPMALATPEVDVALIDRLMPGTDDYVARPVVDHRGLVERVASLLVRRVA